MENLHYLALASVAGITLAVCLWQFYRRSLMDDPRERRIRELRDLPDDWNPRRPR